MRIWNPRCFIVISKDCRGKSHPDTKSRCPQVFEQADLLCSRYLTRKRVFGNRGLFLSGYLLDRAVQFSLQTHGLRDKGKIKSGTWTQLHAACRIHQIAPSSVDWASRCASKTRSDSAVCLIPGHGTALSLRVHMEKQPHVFGVRFEPHRFVLCAERKQPTNHRSAAGQ